jgi:hypothetical protein
MEHMTMSKAQLENLVRNNVERMEEDHGLNEWLPGVATDVHSVEVGVWRCPSGDVLCAEGMCSDECDCCGNAGLWESPFDWQPQCSGCNRPALLVEHVGTFDYSMLVPPESFGPRGLASFDHRSTHFHAVASRFRSAKASSSAAICSAGFQSPLTGWGFAPLKPSASGRVPLLPP